MSAPHVTTVDVSLMQVWYLALAHETYRTSGACKPRCLLWNDVSIRRALGYKSVCGLCVLGLGGWVFMGLWVLGLGVAPVEKYRLVSTRWHHFILICDVDLSK